MMHIPLDIAPEVADARSEHRPVLALESAIISHGMPYPENIETAYRVEKIARQEGAVPATIAILDGRLKAGLTPEEIDRLGQVRPKIAKASRRDIPILVASNENGATTVAATMIIAALAGIHVFATGGLGGVHRNASETFDISADLEELSRTEMAVICSGIKSILDIGLTCEYLETNGVPILGYKTSSLPAFYNRNSGFPVDRQIDEVAEVARIMMAQWTLGLGGGLIVANPIPEEMSMEKTVIDTAIEEALSAAEKKGVTGKEVTPFLLSKVAEITKGDSLKANIALVHNNVRLGARIAVSYSEISANNSRA